MRRKQVQLACCRRRDLGIVAIIYPRRAPVDTSASRVRSRSSPAASACTRASTTAREPATGQRTGCGRRVQPATRSREQTCIRRASTPDKHAGTRAQNVGPTPTARTRTPTVEAGRTSPSPGSPGSAVDVALERFARGQPRRGRRIQVDRERRAPVVVVRPARLLSARRFPTGRTSPSASAGCRRSARRTCSTARRRRRCRLRASAESRPAAPRAPLCASPPGKPRRGCRAHE